MAQTINIQKLWDQKFRDESEPFLVDGDPDALNLADGSVTDSKLAPGINPAKITPGNESQVLTSSGGVVGWADPAAGGGGSPSGAAGGDLTGTYPNPQIATGAVSIDEIADNAVTSGKIIDGAVTSSKIADGTIIDADINASAGIAPTKIAAGSNAQVLTTTGSTVGWAAATATASTEGFIDVTQNGVPNDGTDGTTAMQALITTYATSDGSIAKFYFPAGDYSFTNVTVGDATHGIRLVMRGEDRWNTYIRAGSTSHPAITFTGGGNDQSNGFVWRDISVGSTVDRPYNQPVIKFVRQMRVEIDGVRPWMTGTGTCFAFDTAYEMTIKNVMEPNLGSGVNKYSVFCDIENFVTSQQEDTCLFEHLRLVTTGIIVRGATGDRHGIKFHRLKMIQADSADGGKAAESTLTAATSIGDTVIPVADGTQFAAGVPILVGRGDAYEAAKVSSVSGNNVTVSQPLWFAHSSGDPIQGYGFTTAVGNNTCLFTWDTCHFELVMTGVILDGASDMSFDNCLCSANELVRAIGNTRRLRIGSVRMYGSGSPRVNNVVTVPAYNTATNLGMFFLEGPIDAANALTNYINDPGSNMVHRPYEITHETNAIPWTRRNIAGASHTAEDMTLQSNGVTAWSRDRGGWWSFQDPINVPGTADRVFRWTGGNPETFHTSNVGGIYIRTDGADADHVLYIKGSGTGATGWQAVQTRARQAFVMTCTGAISGTMTDTADFYYVVPFACLIDHMKFTLKSASTGSMTVQARRSTDHGATFANLSGFAVTIGSGSHGDAIVATSTALNEGDVLNFSVASGSGSNLLVEMIGGPT